MIISYKRADCKLFFHSAQLFELVFQHFYALRELFRLGALSVHERFGRFGDEIFVRESGVRAFEFAARVLQLAAQALYFLIVVYELRKLFLVKTNGLNRFYL